MDFFRQFRGILWKKISGNYGMATILSVASEPFAHGVALQKADHVSGEMAAKLLPGPDGVNDKSLLGGSQLLPVHHPDSRHQNHRSSGSVCRR